MWFPFPRNNYLCAATSSTHSPMTDATTFGHRHIETPGQRLLHLLSEHKQIFDALCDGPIDLTAPQDELPSPETHASVPPPLDLSWRYDQLLEQLYATGSSDVEPLHDVLDASPSTITHAVHTLEEEGFITTCEKGTQLTGEFSHTIALTLYGKLSYELYLDSVMRLDRLAAVNGVAE